MRTGRKIQCPKWSELQRLDLDGDPAEMRHLNLFKMIDMKRTSNQLI